jgi:ATP-dependent Lon protease
MEARDAQQSAAPPADTARQGGPAPEAVDVIPEVLPILPVQEMVLFPGVVVPLAVSRPSSLKLLDDSLAQSKVVGLFTQREGATEEPGPSDIYSVGVAANVAKLVRQADGSVVLLVQTFARVGLRKFVLTFPFLKAEVDQLATSAPPAEDQLWSAEVKNLRESALELLRLTAGVPEQLLTVIANLTNPDELADFLAPNLQIDLPQKQALLEELDTAKRVRAVQTHISTQLEIARLQQKLQKDVASRFTDAQRQAYLREQLKAIRQELGEDREGGGEQQLEQLRVRLEQAQLPTEVMAQAERELKRLAFVPEASPEHSVVVSYLETLADLPWQKVSEDNLDLNEAQRILDRDHFGLEKIKRRLIEYLAVRKLNPRGRGPILCFLGPPGVGKTSLGQSIADALGRKFARLSLGGMRDEAENRGHRRTYNGSMPGRIIQELRRAGTRNPVMMLDEIDKVGADFRGDPASALLEVLDPRQNNAYVDR